MYETVIKNGTVVTSTTAYQADIAIQGEQIAAIGKNLSGQREIEASGKLVTPGAVDIHVHMQMPLPGGVVSADTFYTGTRAAAFGGTTTMVDFVAPEADESMLDALAARRAEADPNVLIDYALHMTIGPTEISKLGELPAVVEAGCGSFKLYMAYGFRLNDGELYQALSAIREVSGMTVVHAENWDIICALIAENLAAGRTTPHWHPRSRPAFFEGEAAGRVIDIATYVDTPIHIFHVSCNDVIERTAQARAKGLPITIESCPQYLFLTNDAYDAPGVMGALPVCSPPIRSQVEQDALWDALSKGKIDLVSTDHCPFTKADKARGLDDFSQIPGGVPSIEMRFAALYHKGVREGRISLNRWVDLCCTTPARLVGLHKKGDIAIGYDADLVIFDPEKRVVLSTDTLHEEVDWTPYEGLEIHGWPTMTMCRGVPIVENGLCVAEPRRGRFVPTMSRLT